MNSTVPGLGGGTAAALLPAQSSSPPKLSPPTFHPELKWFQIVMGVGAILAGCVVLAAIVQFVNRG